MYKNHEMIRFEENSDLSHCLMTDKNRKNNIEVDLDGNTSFNQKVKKLYYGKEYNSPIDSIMKQNKNEENSNSSTLEDLENYKYSGEFDLMLQESLSNDGDAESNSIPYRSRCNTWPRLQQQQSVSSNLITPTNCPNADDIKVEGDEPAHIEGSYDSNSKQNNSQLRQILSNASNCSTNASASLLHGCLQGHSTFQQPHLQFPNRSPYSPSVESPLTTRISGSYMLSHQSATPISDAGGMDRVTTSGNTPSIVHSSSVSNQDDALMNSFPSSSLSGPLPLLSEEDMVLENDFMYISKDSSANEYEKLPQDGNIPNINTNSNLSNEKFEASHSLELQSKAGSNIDVEFIESCKMATPTKETETKEHSSYNQTSNKSSSISSANLNHSSSSNFSSSSSGSCGTNASRRNAWGNLSYADLITQAIKSSPDQRLTLSQIYDWLITNIAHFREKSDNVSSLGWKVIIQCWFSWLISISYTDFPY